jgi:hypothetical protein
MLLLVLLLFSSFISSISFGNLPSFGKTFYYSTGPRNNKIILEVTVACIPQKKSHRKKQFWRESAMAIDKKTSAVQNICIIFVPLMTYNEDYRKIFYMVVYLEHQPVLITTSGLHDIQLEIFCQRGKKMLYLL